MSSYIPIIPLSQGGGSSLAIPPFRLWSAAESSNLGTKFDLDKGLGFRVVQQSPDAKGWYCKIPGAGPANCVGISSQHVLPVVLLLILC